MKDVKRNLDDTEAEILFEKDQPERREVLRVVSKGNLSVSAGRERISMRLEPVLDQRCDAISKEAVEQDQDRHEFFSILVNQSFGIIKKERAGGIIFFPDEAATIHTHQ